MSNSQWIPVSERLPNSTGWVLVAQAGGSVILGFFNRPEQTFSVDETAAVRIVERYELSVTHWMPLPDLPQVTRESDKPVSKGNY